MAIVFYAAPMSSATPVACALAELSLPHEVVRLDLAAGDQRAPAFLALNPNGKVPTLVVDGTPLFEALAIVLWLGERYGVDRGLWPAADAPARLEAMSWSAWAYVSFGGALGRLFLATRGPRGGGGGDALGGPAAEFARKEVGELLGVLEGRLGRAAHLLGEAFSLADLIVASAVGYGAFSGVSLGGHPRVRAWLERCQARPSFASSMGG